MVTLKLQKYFVIYKRSPLKMQKIKKYLCDLSLTMTIFFDFSQSFYDASSYGSTFKKVIFNDGFNLN